MRSKIFLASVTALFCGVANHGYAQLMVDERLLWDQRLFEMERLEEKDRTLQFNVYGGFRHDSNLFRLSDDADAQAVLGSSDKSDNIYQAGVGARLNLEKSRQKFVVDGNVEQNWYQNFDNLDNASNLVRGEWAWQAGNDWNGTLGAGHRRFLNSFTYVQQNVRDMIARDRVYGSANYKPVSYIKLSVDADWVKSDHDAESQQPLDNRTDSTAFTASWVTPSENALGVRYRTTDARYPNAGTPFSGDYQDQEYSLVGVWHATAASVLRGRLGRTQREFDNSEKEDFSGPTWRLGYQWDATAKTAVEVAVWRELYGFEDLSGNYVRTTGAGIFPAWSVLPKLILQARLLYQTRDYFGQSAATTAREDKERMAQLAAIWTPLRLTKLIFMVEAGDRDSNQALADYDYQTFSVGVMRTF